MGTLDTSFLDRRRAAPRTTSPERSIAHVLRGMLVSLTSEFAAPGTTVYEFGCACSLLPQLHTTLSSSISFVACDDIESSLVGVRRALASATHDRDIQFARGGFNEGLSMRNASVVLMLGSLHRVRYQRRVPLMAGIHRGLRAPGCVILVEQVLGRDSMLNNVFAAHGTPGLAADAATRSLPHDLAQFPNPLADERALLMNAGFRSVEVFFKWYGLCGLIAVK